MTHNVYGTLAHKDTAFFDNGTSWTEAGYKNASYGLNDIKDGVKNIPNKGVNHIRS